MDDLISRSALVAELEAFKMSMNDIVLRFIVDRVIERVKKLPAVCDALVFCENCKSWEPHPIDGEITLGICRRGSIRHVMPWNGFCTCGERKKPCQK
jgi:hypothetical protein